MVENAGSIPPLTTSRVRPLIPDPPGWKLPNPLLKAPTFVPAQVPPEKMETSTMPTGAGTPRQGVDLAGFGQWLVEQQAQLVQEMMGQQERYQSW